jgi:trehalose-phosphatase
VTTPPDPASRPATDPASRPAAGQVVDAGLEAALRSLALVPRLLVASDYDGVLAPIVEDPARAVPLPEAIVALDRLARLPGTTVAVISGRAREDLAAMVRFPSGVRLVGSHGAELEGAVELTPAQAARRVRLESELRGIVRGWPAVRLETKPAGVSVHTRTAPEDATAAVVEAVRSGPAAWPEVYVTTGKEVVELAVVATGKGAAVESLRAGSAADAVLYLGDDVTDENAFAVLRARDAGVKVGPGTTVAGHRVADPPAAVRLLWRLLELRSPG